MNTLQLKALLSVDRMFKPENAWLLAFCILLHSNDGGAKECSNPSEGGGVTTEKQFAIGADISMLKAIQDAGGKYFIDGGEADPIKAFRDAGFNWVRLRLFHTPDGTHGQVNDLSYTIELARELVGAGFKFLLNFHYSDRWADPGQQRTPEAWRDLSLDELEKAVRNYSRHCVRAFVDAGAAPDMVQIGNEITPGMLWPYGRIAESQHTDNLKWRDDKPGSADARWEAFGRLVKAGIRGTREGCPQTAIMIHVDRGGDANACQWFFDNLLKQGAEFDLIGISYYPFWHGSFDDLRQTLAVLSERYAKDVHVVEIGYPYAPDESHEKLREKNEHFRQFVREYPLSAEGQARFVRDVTRLVKETPGGRGVGVWYWAPEWIPTPDQTIHSCTVRALFDEKGNALPAFFALGGSK
jgi:arabinogalactan endo-1,4-beta-galactosidase